MMFLEGILLVQGKAVTQPVHFFQCHLAEFIRGLWPVKSITVKAFHKDPESGSASDEFSSFFSLRIQYVIVETGI